MFLVYVTMGNARLFRKILVEMGDQHLLDTGEYALIYVDSEFNWNNVYHAMNNHFLRSKFLELIIFTFHFRHDGSYRNFVETNSSWP